MSEQLDSMNVALVELLWRSNIEILPRLIREPRFPPRGAAIVPGQHWADGRARIVSGCEMPVGDDELDAERTAVLLATQDAEVTGEEPPALADGAS